MIKRRQLNNRVFRVRRGNQEEFYLVGGDQSYTYEIFKPSSGRSFGHVDYSYESSIKSDLSNFCSFGVF
jgi:hypothetical protein